MKLSEYLKRELNQYTDYCGENWDLLVEADLNKFNYDIDVDPDPNLIKQHYIPFDKLDACAMVYILGEKLAQYQEELETMKKFIAGDEELWCYLPVTLIPKAFDGFSVKENINPWVSQIHWAEYEIVKFKAVYDER